MDIRFFRYTSIDEKFLTYVLALYERAFPADERRPLADLLELINNNQQFSCNSVFIDDELIGFFNYWDFETFAFIEHFAIDPLKRDRKLGSAVMQKFIEMQEKPIILEIERPTSDNIDTERRLGFYQRLGFSLSKKPYIQPSYAPNQATVPMFLMEKGGELLMKKFETVKETLYREVYKAQ